MYLIVVNPMILLKMAGALSFPAEHDEPGDYKKWYPSCRAIHQNVTPQKTLFALGTSASATMFSRGDILIYRPPWLAPLNNY
jgi:hypothetical protein